MLNFTTTKILYGAIILSKILLILCFLIISYLLVVGLFLINGIGLSVADLSYLGLFFLVTFLTMIIFLILGSICGLAKSIFKAGIYAILIWFLLIILIPEISNIGLSKHTATIFESIYSHELKKLEIFSKAEDSILKEVSKYKTPEDIKSAYKRLIKNYLENDFKKILGLEQKMVKDTMKAANKVHFFNIFTPVTFYKTVNNEISGCAFNGHIDFYKSNIKYYEGFVKYCLENTMNRIRPKDKPFIKNAEDYIFHLKSSLPKYFGAGVALNIFYILMVLFLSYHRFMRVVFQKTENAEAFRNLDFKFDSGKYFVYFYEDSEVPEQLYNVLSGKFHKFTGIISIAGEVIDLSKKKDFVYLPEPDYIPGEIKPRFLLNMIGKLYRVSRPEIEKLQAEFSSIMDKRFADLKRIEKVNILLRLLKFKGGRIYLLNNFLINIDKDPLKEIVEGMKDKDTLIIELISVPPLNHLCFNRYGIIVLSNSFFNERVIEERD